MYIPEDINLLKERMESIERMSMIAAIVYRKAGWTLTHTQKGFKIISTPTAEQFQDIIRNVLARMRYSREDQVLLGRLSIESLPKGGYEVSILPGRTRDEKAGEISATN